MSPSDITTEKHDCLALSMIHGLGNRTFKHLMDKFGSASAIFKAGLSDILTVKGIRKDVAQRIVDRKFVSDPEKEMLKIEKAGIRIVTCNDPEYPCLLKEISYPPVLLFCKGKKIPNDKISIGVVGSRNATSYGRKTAENIGYGLGKRDTVVVSGLALGIDSAAHIGCLRAKGFTVAVLGTGLDQVYPSSNKRLMEQISNSGTVISEFPMGTRPEPRNFPIRNRIISGMSRGIVVVEATKKSGSLITARLALEQNRDVFAVPGSINSFKSTGTHFLIKQGAKLVENAEDILEDFDFYTDTPNPSGARQNNISAQTLPEEMTEEEQAVYTLIDNYPVHIDNIVRASHMEPGKVLSILMKMELDGYITQLPGRMFVINQP